MNEILPDFLEVQPPQAAEAVSEPFVRPEAFKGFISSSVRIELEPAAIGVAYITDEGDVGRAFAISPDVKYPLACVQTYAEGYERAIGRHHTHRKRQQAALPGSSDIADAYHMKMVVEKTREAQLRTIAGFILFASFEDNPHASTFIVAAKPAEEIPLEGRDYMIEHKNNLATGQFEFMRKSAEDAAGSDAQPAIKGIMTNDSVNQDFGMYVGSLHMPSLKEMKDLIGENTRIGDYFRLPRKEKRLLLRQEQKTA